MGLRIIHSYDGLESYARPHEVSGTAFSMAALYSHTVVIVHLHRASCISKCMLLPQVIWLSALTQIIWLAFLH